MADFCRQCSIRMFKQDFRELAGLSTEADSKADMFPVALCESCGATQVDHEGSCIGNCEFPDAHKETS